MEKLQVINDALGATGNTKLNVLNDGSDEWIVADGAFDRAVRDLTSRRNWPFAAAVADLVPADAADNPTTIYTEAYLLPVEVFHITRVLVSVTENEAPALCEDYQIIGRYLCTNYDSGVSIEFVTAPANAAWHPQAAEILTLMVEAGCLRGLNEDFAEARNRDSAAEMRLIEAGPRNTRQNPAHNAFRSSMRDVRRSRMGG